MTSSNRYFINPTGVLRASDAEKELLASLTRLSTLNPPVHTCSTGWSFSGFYAGPTSIAYAFYRLSQLYPGMEFEHQSLLEWAQAYLNLGARLPKKTPSPNHCGVGDETLAHLALTAVMSREPAPVRQLCAYSGAINTPDEDGSNEWLYGRAGYLYLLRLCRTVFSDPGDSPSAELLEKTMKATVDRILAVPRPWVWHGKEYLGAAHGTISIICQAVLSTPSVAPQLQPLLSDLLDRQFESGNFPSSLPAGSDRLVQFCHGGPGLVLSLRSLLPYFPGLQASIRGAISAAQSDIWQRGLLTKEPCLCHGIAGNALALDDEREFQHFLSFMSTDSIERHFDHTRRNSDGADLYTGEAGRAWVWAIAAQGQPKTCIGYNDI